MLLVVKFNEKDLIDYYYYDYIHFVLSAFNYILLWLLPSITNMAGKPQISVILMIVFVICVFIPNSIALDMVVDESSPSKPCTYFGEWAVFFLKEQDITFVFSHAGMEVYEHRFLLAQTRSGSYFICEQISC